MGIFSIYQHSTFTGYQWIWPENPLKKLPPRGITSMHVEMSDARAPAHQRDGVVAATASAQCARAELPSSKSATASASTTAQHNPLSGGGLPASKARHGPEHLSVEFYREGVKTAVTAVSDRATGMAEWGSGWTRGPIWLCSGYVDP